MSSRFGAEAHYGAQEQVQLHEIKGIAADATKVRIRRRMHEFTKVWVRTASGITRHYLLRADGGWLLSTPVEANRTLKG